MKCAIAIMASTDFEDFKELWIRNITRFKESLNGDRMDFYFIYATPEKESTAYNALYTDMWIMTDKSFPSDVLPRVLGFYQRVDDQYTHVLKTTLTTLFNLDKLVEWMNCTPEIGFLGGTIVPYGKDVFCSGINLVLSMDLVRLFQTRPHDTRLLDDVYISFLVQSYGVSPASIKMLAFAKGIEFHASTMTDTGIFCFRFKSTDRTYDRLLMELLLEDVYMEDFKLVDFITRNNLIHRFGAIFFRSR